MGSYLRRLNDILTRIAEAITVLALAVIAVVIPYEVLGRYVLADMPSWSGETATFSLVWLSMMGSAAGFRKGYQISLNSLIDRLPPRSARVVVRSGLFLLMAFLVVMI